MAELIKTGKFFILGEDICVFMVIFDNEEIQYWTGYSIQSVVIGLKSMFGEKILKDVKSISKVMNSLVN